MALSMQEKQHVGKEVALRYLHARKKEKGVMLQEFCATTGYSPPYAAHLLRTYARRVILGAVTLVPTRPSPWPRQRKHLYGLAVVEALVWMYHLSGDLCGKRLQAAMPELLRAMGRHGTLLPDPLSTALLQMGSATMDRLLREEKTRGENRRHAPRTKPGSLLRLIPIVSSRELSAAAPGQVEVDLVSHDGGKAAGDHCYTLTVTDRCSGWRVASFQIIVKSLRPFPKKYHAPMTPLHQFLQAPEVSDQAKARLLRQLRDLDPLAVERDIGILEARLLRKNSQDVPLGAVTEQTISL